ncbi:hypothetical protein ASPBRDRAFT_613215 [Aspergillus brasiliensis CBS 101740]|uniref:Uncharacterized protein n=1 Tax=Aspergillus brasiliensis (strain CBS 101740 / IMI 381727 / IBT 21946) TaxID=767769 RepID=A0A1L9UIG7_ASPBC|nr:hypothetical protein ASPBRDRAFT_613215 [Aspergillus brasiliensis CBS 101740]
MPCSRCKSVQTILSSTPRHYFETKTSSELSGQDAQIVSHLGSFHPHQPRHHCGTTIFLVPSYLRPSNITNQGWMTYLQKTNSTVGSGRKVNEAGTMGRAGEESRVEMQEKREEGAAEIITMDCRLGLGPYWEKVKFTRNLPKNQANKRGMWTVLLDRV